MRIYPLSKSSKCQERSNYWYEKCETTYVSMKVCNFELDHCNGYRTCETLTSIPVTSTWLSVIRPTQKLIVCRADPKYISFCHMHNVRPNEKKIHVALGTRLSLSFFFLPPTLNFFSNFRKSIISTYPFLLGMKLYFKKVFQK
jgi:hypothetical protein